VSSPAAYFFPLRDSRAVNWHSDSQIRHPWFLLIFLHGFVVQCIILVVRVATTYRALELGADPVWIGIIGGTFGILPALLGLHLGRLIDRSGETVPLRAGSGVLAFAALIFWLLGANLAALVLGSTALGLGQFACLAGQYSAVARCAPEGQRDRFFGLFTVAISLAQAVSPGLLSFFGSDSPFPDTDALFLTGFSAAVALLAVSFFIRLPPHRTDGHQAGLWHSALTVLRTKGFGLSVLAGMVIFSAIDLLTIYLPLYGIERELSAGSVGGLLALRAGASIVSRLWYGRLVAFLGRAALLVTSMLVAGGGIAMLLLTSDLLFVAAGMSAAGFGLGIGAPLTLAWVAEIAPLDVRSTALSIRLGANRIGQVVVPIAVGVAAAGIGAAGIFCTIAVTLWISGFLIGGHFRLSGRRPSK
jgi:MFS family permease